MFFYKKFSAYLIDGANMKGSELLSLAQLTPEEYCIYESFGSEQRKREWLLIRALINNVFKKKVVISYNAYGAPLIEDCEISISHKNNFAALIIGEKRCAIDVEKKHSDIAHRIVSKFLCEKELPLLDEIPASLLWSIKECAFKYYQKGAVDFKSDIFIHWVKNGEFLCSLKKSSGEILQGRYFEHGDFFVCLIE